MIHPVHHNHRASVQRTDKYRSLSQKSRKHQSPSKCLNLSQLTIWQMKLPRRWSSSARVQIKSSTRVVRPCSWMTLLRIILVAARAIRCFSHQRLTRSTMIVNRTELTQEDWMLKATPVALLALAVAARLRSIAPMSLLQSQSPRPLSKRARRPSRVASLLA